MTAAAVRRRATVRARAVIVIAALLASAAATLGVTPAHAKAPGCPDAAKCRLYKTTPARWRLTRGRAVIHYTVNTTQPWVVTDQVLLAIDAATKMWETADPSIDFVFDGTTDAMPQLGDGVNEISWVTTMDPATIAVTNYRTKGATRVETDTILNVFKPWTWQGCDGTIVSCADATGTGLHFLDVQAAITQQLGHWLGLASLDTADASNLTMYAQFGYGVRRFSTLGLGDALGVRAAYPCRKCPPIRIFTP